MATRPWTVAEVSRVQPPAVAKDCPKATRLSELVAGRHFQPRSAEGVPPPITELLPHAVNKCPVGQVEPDTPRGSQSSCACQE
jgi:hypothetical protein